MGVMKRLSGIVQAKANKVLDRAEDPRETLDLSYEKQLEQLTQVRRGLADVATARKRIELQAQQLQASAAKLQEQARQALGQNREDLAREFLGRRASIATQLQDMKTQHDQLVSQEERLVATTQQLQARVEAFRTQKETLKASYTAAQAQTKIGEAVSGISESMSDTGLAMERARDKIANMQARAGAVDELLSSGALEDLSGSTDPLQAELDKGTRASQVELELEQLKSQLGAPAPAQVGGAPSPRAAIESSAVPPAGAGAASAAGEASTGEEGSDDEEAVDGVPADAVQGSTAQEGGDLFSLGQGAGS
jgi:phage shock protein A